MALVRHSFDGYKLWYYSARQYNWRVIVNLYDDNAQVGRLTFMKQDEDLPDNKIVSTNVIYLYYPFHCFETLMETLRREEPLYVGMVDTNLIGFVGTDAVEPVGEEEPDD